jgi:APA family basic amino acid/polyamine antiporter
VTTPDIARAPEQRLDRAIGPWTLGANAVNLSLGAGIFVLPATVAAILGPAAIAAYLVCAVAIALVLACFAEVGGRTSRSGGAVAYVEEAFGQNAGFATWVVYSLVFCVASDAAIANVLVNAVASAVPAVGDGITRVAVLAALFGGLAAVNVIGVRQGARVAVATTTAKVAPLVVVVAGGALVMHLDALRWTGWPSAARLGEASLLLFFAYAGAECALTPGGEVEDPARTVPRGMLGGAGALVLLYIAVQVVTQGALGADLPAHADAPLAAVAELVLGPAGMGLIVVCTGLSVFGTLSGDLLASPRAFLPMAQAGILPRRLGAIHPRFRTPHVAIVTYATMIFVLAVSGAFKPLAVMSSVALLVVYLAVCLATLRLRAMHPRRAGEFRTPGGPVVPLAGAAVVCWLLAQSTWIEAAAMAGTLAASTAYYGLRRVAAMRGGKQPTWPRR